MGLDTYYPSNPWANVDKNQRNIFFPILRDTFERQRIYSNYVTTMFNLGSINAPQMTITSLIPPFVNFDPIGLRQLWMESSYVDSFARVINFQRYGGKMSFHEYDDLITYWQQNGARGLAPIVNAGIGSLMTKTIDTLARNTFFANPALGTGFGLFGDGAGADFGDIGDGASYKMKTGTILDIHLGMKNRDVPYTADVQGNWGNIVCIASPGAIKALREEGAALGTGNAFIPTSMYTQPSKILNREQFTYQNVRFVETNDATLWNCGNVTVQTTVTEALAVGDGAEVPTTAVDGAYFVGQSGRKNYIPVAATTSFAVNDIISIHTSRTSAFGVTDGCDFRDGTKQDRRIVRIASGKLILDKPVMIPYATDLGSGVYAYVTKAKHISTALFIGGNDGVVWGIGRPPHLNMLQPVDDFNSMYRVTWDGYFAFKVFEPVVYEVWFGAGDTRIKGAKVAG